MAIQTNGGLKPVAAPVSEESDETGVDAETIAELNRVADAEAEAYKENEAALAELQKPTPEVDSAGVVYDPLLHVSKGSKSMYNRDGTWKAKPKRAKKTITKTEAETPAPPPPPPTPDSVASVTAPPPPPPPAPEPKKIQASFEDLAKAIFADPSLYDKFEQEWCPENGIKVPIDLQKPENIHLIPIAYEWAKANTAAEG